MPWQKSLILLAIKDEENNGPSGSKESGPFSPGLPNALGQQAPNYPSVYSNHSQNRHMAMSDLSSDIDMCPETEVASSLYDLLEAEAWRQEQQKKL